MTIYKLDELLLRAEKGQIKYEKNDLIINNNITINEIRY